MSVVLRRLDLPADLPVDPWLYEGVVTVLDRGSVGDWARVSRRIKHHPWGVLARQVEEFLAHDRPYGVAPLFERVIATARRNAEQAERAEVAAEVDALVRASGMTSRAFAARIGTSGSRLSTYRSGRVVPSAPLMVRMRRVASGR